VSDKTVTI